MILGTGSNGCYMERAERVQHWETEHARVRDVCVDVEWGAFGDNGCLDFMRTDLDKEVDGNSLLATSFTLVSVLCYGRGFGSVRPRRDGFIITISLHSFFNILPKS